MKVYGYKEKTTRFSTLTKESVCLEHIVGKMQSGNTLGN